MKELGDGRKYWSCKKQNKKGKWGFMIAFFMRVLREEAEVRDSRLAGQDRA